jgi:metallophosphoesterase (TIGR00282 family)
MGAVGIEIVEKVLPQLKKTEKIDLVIAQAENVSEGKGVTLADFKRLQKCGVDFFSGGNHTFDRPEIFPALNDPNQPIIRPANYPEGTPGLGWKYARTAKGNVLVVSLLGQVVGKQADEVMENPLQVIDAILESQKDVPHVATVVNFHGDFSSEKVVIGHYLDGRVTAVVGDHWHVPTADARVLPGGTAHQTDVGMCGVLDSSLGVTYESIIPRWREGKQTRNTLATGGLRQFNALFIETDDKTGLAVNVKTIQKVL